MKLADEMLELNVWSHLHAAKLIDNPNNGVSLDLKTAWAQYQNITFSTDPHGARAYCLQDSAPETERQYRGTKRQQPEETRSNSYWHGKKPKNVMELAEWCKQHGGEPEGSEVEDDSDLYPSDHDDHDENWYIQR